MKKDTLGLEFIDGHLGDQMEIEEILKSSRTVGGYLLEKLPDCPQRQEYARCSYENAMKRKEYFSGAEAARFLPESEMVDCLEEIIRKSLAIDRVQWAEDAIKAFPRSGHWDERRKELLESVVKIHLSAGQAHWAQETAKEIPRKLTSLELETVIANNLAECFSNAENALDLTKRSFTVGELRIAAEGARKKMHWSLLLKIAQLFAGKENSAEREVLINEAHQAFLRKGDSSGIAEVCKIQGNRKMTTDELKAIFEKDCLDDGMMLNSVSHYATELVRDSGNVTYLEIKAKELIAERTGNALHIALALPEKSVEKISILESIGAKVLRLKQEMFIKKCAAALPEGNEIRTKLAKYLVAEVGKKVGKFESIQDGKKVETALEVVILLPKGDEKRNHLMKLYASAKRIENGLDRRVDQSPSGFFAVKEALNHC